jgi:hypothetical protein
MVGNNITKRLRELSAWHTIHDWVSSQEHATVECGVRDGTRLVRVMTGSPSAVQYCRFGWRTVEELAAKIGGQDE